MSVNPIKGKFVRLQNDEMLKARNQADTAEVEILKVNTSDQVELALLPVFDDGIDVSQVATEKYTDSEIATVDGRISDHIGAVTGAHAASAISFNNISSELVATNVQGALDEVESRIDALEVGGGDTKELKVSANDTTPGFLESKIVGQSNKISISTLNDGLDEDLRITIGSDVFDKSVDTTTQITEGTKLFFTDERARAAAVFNGISEGVTDIAPSQDAVWDALALKLNLAGGTMSGNILMGNNSIINLVMTADAHSAATREYVDNVAEGLHVHAPVRAVRAPAIVGTYDNGVDGVGATITPTTAVSNIDGLGSFAIGQRIIISGQSNSWENGIYAVSAVDGSNHVTEFTRASDFNTPEEVAGGDFIFVQSGTTYANTGWVETKATTALGFGVSDPIEFLQFSGAGAYTAGDGLDLTGTVFSVNVSEISGAGLEDDGSNNFRIASSAAGSGLSMVTPGVIDVSTSSGIEISGDAIQVKLATLASGGLDFSPMGEVQIASSAAGHGIDLAMGVLSVNPMDLAGTGLTTGPMNTLSVKVAPFGSGGLELSGFGEVKIADSAAGDGLNYFMGALSVDASDIVGNGLQADPMNNLEVRLAISSGLQVDFNGLALSSSLAGDGLNYLMGNLSVDANDLAGNGLQADPMNNLQVKLTPSSGLQVDFNGLALSSDSAGAGLSFNMGALSVKTGDGIELSVGNQNITVNVSDLTGLGLEDDGSNNLQIKKEFALVPDISVGLAGLSIANRWYKQSYPISGTVSAGVNDTVVLSFEPESGSMSAFVDRLAIHEGEDYTISGSTVTFIGALATIGQQQLSAGDTIFFKYQKKAA